MRFSHALQLREEKAKGVGGGGWVIQFDDNSADDLPVASAFGIF